MSALAAAARASQERERNRAELFGNLNVIEQGMTPSANQDVEDDFDDDEPDFEREDVDFDLDFELGGEREEAKEEEYDYFL